MMLLHLSISADEPERVATVLATLLGGRAMPFPPFPDSWIAFAARDDGTAIEIYPTTHVLVAGEDAVRCRVDAVDQRPTFAHAAIGSALSAEAVLGLAEAEGWPARRCHRGPFACIEMWIEGRLLVEVLDPGMLADYRRGMTMERWAAMFDLG